MTRDFQNASVIFERRRRNWWNPRKDGWSWEIEEAAWAAIFPQWVEVRFLSSGVSFEYPELSYSFQRLSAVRAAMCSAILSVAEAASSILSAQSYCQLRGIFSVQSLWL